MKTQRNNISARPGQRPGTSNNNTNPKTTPRGKSGFTLLEIMIIVSIIATLLIIAIPCWVRARGTSHQTTCINNLRQIQSAVLQWALENKAGETSPVQFSDIQSYMRATVVCPAGGTSFADSYTITDVQTLPKCQKLPTGPEAHALGPDVTN